MSASTSPAVAARPSGSGIPFAPAEGWLTAGLVLLLCLSLAWSLDDAGLILGRGELTDMLPWVAVLGVALGLVGAKAGWGRWRTYLLGSVAGGVAVPVIVGTVLLPDGAAPSALIEATAAAALGAFEDLVINDQSTTPEIGHHLWILGLLVWATSMYAAYTSFGHRRPLHAVILLGMLLVGNIAFTTRDHLVYLVLFTLAALFLLIRFHTLDEQADWVRRRIGDPGPISGLYLRGGTIFIVAAVTGSLVLTQVASSDPLSGMWTNMSGRLIEWSRAIERFLPAPASGISLGPSFGPTAEVRGYWVTNESPALTIELEDPTGEVPYWAAWVYDTYAMDRWDTSPITTRSRVAGEYLLDGTAEAVDPVTRRALTVTITPAFASSIVFSPLAPSVVDESIDVDSIGDAGFLATLRRATSSEPYTITADLAILGDAVEGGVTANRLRVAGTDYPEEIIQLYTSLPADALGPNATTLREAILRASPSDRPYDIAETMVRYLQDPDNFVYDTDVRRFDCADIGVVECFATFRYGYCEYYASTMAVLLRSMGIPTRLVEGYQRGEVDTDAGVRRVRQSDAHAWVQVYFPGYGWVDFDPTGGGEAELAPIPSGAPVDSPGPGASSTPRPIPTRAPINEPTLDPAALGPGGTGGRGAAAGPLIAVTLVLAVVVGALVLTAWRRGPRGPVSADGAYDGMARLAERLGFGPRPHQTVYEYTGSLADVMPGARPELEIVARAKVETAYGARVLDDDRLRSLREAQRRLRSSLVALGVRRVRGRFRR